MVLIGLVLLSQGRTRPFLNESGETLAGSISEKIFVEIGGLRQGMFIKGKDERRPVLLILHGGLPEYFLSQIYPTGLDELFVLVWWEQRGSGLSYSPEIKPKSITVKRLISDTLEITNYLRRRFSQRKIYLMGHSGGSFIGIQAAAQAPELYHAYIGVAQMSNQLRSELRAYQYLLEQFKTQDDLSMLGKLEASPVTLRDGTPPGYLAIRDQAMHSLGVGTMHRMHSVITGLFLPSLLNGEYTLQERLNLWIGKGNSGVSSLWDTMLVTDLACVVSELRIPVYLLHGIHDYTCSYPEAKSYFDKLKAPVKGFYTFWHSAHSPHFEEPERMQEILLTDVLQRKTSLAELS